MKNLLFVFAMLFTLSACKSKKEITSSEQTTTKRQATSQREARTDKPERKRGDKKGPPSVEEVFKMDTNNDGKLARSEVKGKLLEKFSEIDTNSDGFISKEEFSNAPRPGKGQRPPRN